MNKNRMFKDEDEENHCSNLGNYIHNSVQNTKVNKHDCQSNKIINHNHKTNSNSNSNQMN